MTGATADEAVPAPHPRRVDPTAAVDVVCYHHRPDAALLLDAALPAARDAASHGLSAHLERHWLHGPHVRVRLRGPARRLGPAAAAARDRLRRHLTANDAPPQLDPADLLARSVAAGRAELVPGPYEPIHPHGTVVTEPADDRRLAGLLGAAAVDRRRELLTAALDPITATAAHLRDADGTDDAASARVRAALAAMTAHAASYPDGLARGAISFASHLEDFLHLNDPDRVLRRGLGDAWRRNSGAVTETVAAMSAGHPPDALHAAWSAWAKWSTDVCRAAFRRGELPLRPGDGYRDQAQAFDPATARRWDHDSRTDYSPFHRTLLGRDWTAEIADRFGPYRFATNVLYTALVVCGVTPMDRYLAAHLLVEAARQLGAGAQATSPATPTPPQSRSLR